jgi:hypothetical protein
MDHLGRIAVPSIPSSGQTFPLRTEYPAGYELDLPIVEHRFQSEATFAVQRFSLGPSARRFVFSRHAMSYAERQSLITFWEAMQGSYSSFAYAAPNPDGTFTTYQVVFDTQPLSITQLVNQCSAGLIFIEIVTVNPTYTVNQSQLRFPDPTTLAPALLSQTQTIIPLIHIRVLDSSVADVWLSDRRLTLIGILPPGIPSGTTYLPRVTEIGDPGTGIIMSQDIRGKADQVRFTLGNADRVMSLFSIDTALKYASIDLSIFHVQTGILLQLWKGIVVDFTSDGSAKFPLTCSDGVYPITQNYPRRVVSRQCWKTFNDGRNCPWAAVSGVGNPSSCDFGYDTINGCLSHGMAGGVNKGAYFGGHPGFPQSLVVKNPNTGLFGSNLLTSAVTSTSIASSSIYGQPLQEIYCNNHGNPMNSYIANCLVVAVDDRGYAEGVLGIVGAGTIGGFSGFALQWTPDGYPILTSPLADGNPPGNISKANQGFINLPSPGTTLYYNVAPSLGVRVASGTDPIIMFPPGTTVFGNLNMNDPFSMGLFVNLQAAEQNTGVPAAVYDVPDLPYPGGGGGFSNQFTGKADDIVPFAAGTALCEILYSKTGSVSPTLPESHTMTVPISMGLPGSTFYGGAASDYADWPGLTNPFWILANTYLRAIGLDKASSVVQAAALVLPSFSTAAYGAGTGTGAADIADYQVQPLVAPQSANPIWQNTPLGNQPTPGGPPGEISVINQTFTYWTSWPPVPNGQGVIQNPPAIISLTSAAGLGYVVQVAAFGNETQFQFQGSISQLKPWRDWGIELMNCTLGYFLFEFGALKVGIRFDAVPTSAFTAGNMLYQSLSLSPCKESLFGGPTDIDYLKVFFADMNLQFQENFAEYEDKDHEGFRGRPGAPLTSTMRSVGISTLSQGLRVAITRQREESGGILRPDLSTSAKYIEWANYLDATFKTTILALGTEAGQVISITNPIVATYPGPPPPIPPATLPTNSNPSGPFPASTWPFRIIRWTLHQDWSVTINARSVTDSMYNVDVGPKVQPVPPASLPVLLFPQPLGQWAPYQVQADPADALYPGEYTFDLQQQFITGAANEPIPTAVLTGQLPVDQFIVGCPAVGASLGNIAHIASVSPPAAQGYIPGGTTWYVQVCAINAKGQYSPPSRVLVVQIPTGTSTNQFVLSGIQWPNFPGLTGWVVFVGSQPDLICGQIIGALTGSPGSYSPTSITVGTSTSVTDPPGLAFARSSFAVPNSNSDGLVAKARSLIHGGVVAGSATSVIGTDIVSPDCIDLTSVDNWAGRKLAIIGRAATGGAVLGLSIVSGGLLFTPGNIVTLIQTGSGDNCLAVITGVSGLGAATSATLLNGGGDYQIGNAGTTGGAGLGLVFNITSVTSPSIPFAAFNVVSFAPSTGSFTLDRSAASAGVAAGDTICVLFNGYDNHLTPTVLTDTGLSNEQNKHVGEPVNAVYLKGQYALVIQGTSRGQSAKIISNTSTSYTLATPLIIDSTSVWIIVGATTLFTSSVIEVANSDPTVATQIPLSIPNYNGGGLWIEALTQDLNANQSSNQDAPGRMMWIEGQPGGAFFGYAIIPPAATITPDWNNGIKQKFELTSSVTTFNATINLPSSGSGGQDLWFSIAQDSVGGRTITWNATGYVGMGTPPQPIPQPVATPLAVTLYHWTQTGTPGILELWHWSSLS